VAVQREIFDSDHEAFRSLVHTFIAREMTPHLAKWDAAGVVDRSLWLAAGRAGILAPDVSPEYGGGGVDDYRYHAIRNEELARAGTLSPAFNLHSEVAGGYLSSLATEDQKRRWLPGFCSGESISTIAITEPQAGSDVSAIRTTARAEGDDFVLRGQKTFVTHGLLADDIIVVAIHPDQIGGGNRRTPRASLFVVHPDMPGVVPGRRLPKIGLHSLDTVEIFLDDVRVPRANLLGKEGLGFVYLLNNLPRERLSIAVSALALAERLFEDTLGYCRERVAFGQPLTGHQHIRFQLAEMATALQVARPFTDRCIMEHDRGTLAIEEASMAKLWNTELCKKVSDQCLQLHGAYGYSSEGLIGRAFVDSRVQTIYGGTTEIMKEIIGQAIAL
jgi:alkylation response protein AidB-like acyl-CoA dehydrogenase